MTKIISILGLSGLSMMSLILLCSVFKSENAFSIHWSKKIAPVEYNRIDNAIYFSFPFHQYTLNSGAQGYLSWCHFSYSLEDKYFSKLMSVETKNQKGADRVSILLHNKKDGKSIEYFTVHNPTKGMLWLQHTDLTLEVDVTKYTVGTNELTQKIGHLRLKWNLSTEHVKFFKIVGLWCTDNLSRSHIFELNYPLDNVKSKTSIMNNAPSDLHSEISDNVKVTGETDTIIITGAEPGENIKIYTVSGVEVKSVVANDDVVNIKLAKNQIYIVKAGQARYKVAL